MDNWALICKTFLVESLHKFVHWESDNANRQAAVNIQNLGPKQRPNTGLKEK